MCINSCRWWTGTGAGTGAGVLEYFRKLVVYSIPRPESLFFIPFVIFDTIVNVIHSTMGSEVLSSCVLQKTQRSCGLECV